MTPWLAVIGIGEDGFAGLSAAARALVEGAELLVGGERHLALVPPGPAERLVWRQPIADTVALIAAKRGARVVVPQPSAFSLAAARLLWPLEECVTLSLHGRPLEALRVHLVPGARLLLLTTDGDTPVQVAKLLSDAGWGPSAMTVFAHMGGERERKIEATAETWPLGRIAALNTLAIECRPGPGARPLSRLAGLPDDAFEHDGQITKRAARAATLAALAPLPGELLWDVGAGCGSIAIEWLRSCPRMNAIAIERDAMRCATIGRNAVALGVPGLRLVHGVAPAALADLPAPDAIFLGGGVGEERLWEALWAALKPGGRLVANAVTLDGEAQLLRWHAREGGDLVRIAISQVEPVGSRRGWRPLRPVTQLAVVKPQSPSS
jgi:precorrin-6B C5,15-methyltransferase / cobalt-precorrin-6B C5,C15-methyltransferase